MIYDCSSFFNELDLLEIRLNTLDKVVEKFILAESPFTHTGHPKPLYYAENKNRFAKFNDRIIHIVVDDFPFMPDDMPVREKAWTRENWQRNSIVRGLPTDISDDDVLLISDLDEIPDPESVAQLVKTKLSETEVLNLNLRNYAFFLNNRCISIPFWHGGPQMISFGKFSSPSTYKDCVYSEECIGLANAIPSATLIRFLPQKKNIENAGWHFSSLGGAKAVQKKILSIAHTEFAAIAADPAQIEKAILSGKGVFGLGDRHMPEPLSNGFPRYLIDNANRFSTLILQTDVASWRRKRWVRSWFRWRKAAYDTFVVAMIKITPRFLHPIMRRIRKAMGL